MPEPMQMLMAIAIESCLVTMTPTPDDLTITNRSPWAVKKFISKRDADLFRDHAGTGPPKTAKAFRLVTGSPCA
jgi:hypothetical protein